MKNEKLKVKSDVLSGQFVNCSTGLVSFSMGMRIAGRTMDVGKLVEPVEV